MSETPGPAPGIEELPEAEVRTRNHFSLVWIIPLVAALVGGWLAYKALTEKGPRVTITFSSAEGLEAGKTKVRYKEVEIGSVDAIDLSEDLSRVIVSASLVKGAERHLNEKTRFWVVRARVGGGQVSGLGTLFSGAYIGIDPGAGEKKTLHFEGLEKPPVVTMDAPGKRFSLRADKLGSLDVGSPVYFRQIQVGQVVGYELAPAGRAVNIEIFIHAPHDKRVFNNTRFWNARGLSVNLDTKGVKVNTESLLSLLIGGIAFETPENLEPGGQAEENALFRLYDNYSSIHEKTYALKQYFVLYFDESIRGLSLGAPVEFRGIQLGEVVDISLLYKKEDTAFRIPVLIALEPERIDFQRDPDQDREEFLEILIRKGLRGQLRTGSLLTGQLFVDLGFHPGAPPPPAPEPGGRYLEIPTIPAPLQEITASLTSALNRVGKIPFEEIARNLNRLIADMRHLAATAEGEVTGVAADIKPALAALGKALEETRLLVRHIGGQSVTAVDGTLDQARKTMAAAEKLFSSDSILQNDLQKTLNELSDAARAVRLLAESLERHPEALIRGKGGE